MRTAGDDVVREDAAILYAVLFNYGAMMTSAVRDAGAGALERRKRRR